MVAPKVPHNPPRMKGSYKKAASGLAKRATSAAKKSATKTLVADSQSASPKSVSFTSATPGGNVIPDIGSLLGKGMGVDEIVRNWPGMVQNGMTGSSGGPNIKDLEKYF